MNIDMTTLDVKKIDEGRVRFIERGDQTFKVECRDPYGFWYIQPMHGIVPDELAGIYTSFGLAKRAVDSYTPIKETTVG